MHSMRLGFGLGYGFCFFFDGVYGLAFCIGSGLRFSFGFGLQLWLGTLALYEGSTCCVWPWLDLSLGLACAWGVASHETTAQA